MLHFPRSLMRRAAPLAMVLAFAAPLTPATAATAKPKKSAAAKPAAKPAKPATVNAYDIFLAATKLAVDQHKVGFALSKTHTSGDPLDREYTLDEKTLLVQENAPALAKLREGFAAPYHNPPVRSFAAMMPYYAEFRAMARLLSLEASVAHEKNDMKTAIGSSLDAIQLGEMIQRDSTIIGMLVGVACQAIGRRPLLDMVNISGVEIDGAKDGAQRLSGILAMHTPYTEVLKTEKQTDLASLTELYAHPAIAATAAQNSDTGDDSGGQQQAASQMFSMLLQEDKDQVITSFSNQMDSLIERYGQPYDNTLVPISRQSDPLSLANYKLLYESRFKDVASELASRCLMVMLALHAYHADHKAYPASLQDLTPSYLPRVPGDPFAQDAPLHYSLMGQDSFTLYSVGPDGKDDDGAPAINQFAKSENTKTVIFPDSQGDFNALINHY